jgi:hypothetical protein
MNEKTRLLLILSTSFLFILIAIFAYMWAQGHPTKEHYTLNVTVVYPMHKTPIANIVVEVVTVNGRIVAQQSTDVSGLATLNLEGGQYIVRIASGYTGQVEVNLQSKQSVQLQALPVMR